MVAKVKTIYPELVLQDGYSPNHVHGDGPIPCDVIVIGEAPGADEDAQGKPFVGRSGQLLTRVLSEAGLDRSGVYITNVVKQRPPGNRKPTAAEITAHFEYLCEELVETDAKYALLLGNTALDALTFLSGGIMKHRGRIDKTSTIFQGMHDSMKIIYATIHPSAALRSKGNGITFEADIRTFATLVSSDYKLVTRFVTQELQTPA